VLTGMSSRNPGDQDFYWSIDVPGMTEEQARRLASIIRTSGLDLEPLLVNPANFLTFHIDRESAETLRSGLLGIRSNSIGDGLRESIEEWLASTAE
jgi:hypothetical protein